MKVEDQQALSKDEKRSSYFLDHVHHRIPVEYQVSKEDLRRKAL